MGALDTAAFLLSVARLPPEGPWLCVPVLRRVCLCRGQRQLIAAHMEVPASGQYSHEKVLFVKPTWWRLRGRVQQLSALRAMLLSAVNTL
jgi:hypothetical protein